MNKLVVVKSQSNREFLQSQALPGRIGLVGGASLIEQAIKRAERHLDADQRWSLWSHAMVFEGQRADGQHWVIESDLQIHQKHIQLGVQENRIAKYFDDRAYPSLAVLDFGLAPEQVGRVLGEALEMMASHTRYSLRELVGTLLALKRPGLRSRENLLARERSLYCSAFVHHVFRQAGVDLAPGLDLKNTTPEDISRTPVPHVTYLRQRGG